MDIKKNKFYAFYKNAEYVERDDLQSIIGLGGYDFIVLVEIYEEFYINSTRVKETRYNYRFIDEYGKEITLKIGDFECVALGVIYSKMESRIRDIKRNTIHVLNIEHYGIESIKIKLLPELTKINELGSFMAYEVFDENQQLKKRIANLTDQNKELIQKNADNFNKIKELEAAIANQSNN